MKRSKIVFAMLAAVGLFVAVGCQIGEPAKPAPTKSLYERLGGEKGIRDVVQDFIPRTAANPKVNFFRDKKFEGKVDVKRLENLLVEFVGSATGGPQKYTGRDMEKTHTGMKITDAEFDAAAGDLKASLIAKGVKEPELGEVLTIVGTTRKSMVGK